MMKGWMKCTLAGALVLVASFWGGSVRAAQMPLGPDDAVPGQLAAQAAVLPTGAHFLSPGNSPSIAAGSGT